MFVTRNWYVAARSAEVGTAPLGRVICGRRIALFREASGVAHAIDALCPHRGADLSAGRVVDDALQCPFHGFRFDRNGRCVEVPSQLEQAQIPERLGVSCYPAVEQQGLLWLWPEAGSTPDRQPPRYDFFDAASGFRRCQCAAELYPASYLNTIENALDGGHLAFVHTASVPGASRLVGNFRISIYEDGAGFRGVEGAPVDVADADRRRQRQQPRWSIGQAWWRGVLQRLALPFLELAPIVQSGFIYELSGMVCFDIHYANGRTDYVLALITPSDAQHTWFFAEQVRNRALNPVGDLVTRGFMDTLVGEDRDALTLLLPEARGAGGLPHPALVRGDRTSTPFRLLYGAALRREGKSVPWAVEEKDVLDVSHGPASVNISTVES